MNETMTDSLTGELVSLDTLTPLPSVERCERCGRPAADDIWLCEDCWLYGDPEMEELR